MSTEDTRIKISSDVRKKRALDWAEIIDAFRVVPRILLIVSGIFVYWITDWYMNLQTRGTAESIVTGLVSLIIPAVIGLYQNSGRKY